MHRSIEEAGHKVPSGPFDSENEQCIALVYQLRNAFAHDIAEPKWEMRNPVFEKEYVIADKTFDLRGLSGQKFRYEDFSVQSLFFLKAYAERNLFGANHQSS